MRWLVFHGGWGRLGRAHQARSGHLSEGPALAGQGLRPVAEGEQVEFDAGPVAVVVVIRSVEPWLGRRLPTVVARQGCDEQGHHDDEQDDVHGSNYPLYKFVPRVAIMTSSDKFLPYLLTC